MMVMSMIIMRMIITDNDDKEGDYGDDNNTNSNDKIMAIII